MNAHDVLLEAAKLVRKGWTQDSGARDANGVPVNYRSQEAVCWCLYGAISCVVEDDAADHGNAYEFVCEAIGESPIKWNDALGRTAEEVALKLEEAAQLALKGKA